jgi:hypothetical protein
MFVDVAEDKIVRGAYNHGITGLKPTPVMHFSKVQLPVVRAAFVHSKTALPNDVTPAGLLCGFEPATSWLSAIVI